MRETRETGSMAENDLLGRSKEMEFLRRWLRKPYQAQITGTDSYGNFSLLSVVGLGGMGKTTLLQHVYKDEVTEEFDLKIWLCVSDNFNAKTVIKNILESVKKERSPLDSLESLQGSLQSEVMSKRFLLVLDDIWEDDEREWSKVLDPLSYGSSGSKILITTRMDSVASTFVKMVKRSKETLQVKGLEEDEFWQLFNAHAFAGVENPDYEFRSIARKMVEKLSGCPLAAKVIGGVLNSYVDKSYWTRVLNTNIGNVEFGQNYLLLVLKLSYIYLPKSLQNCFAFCSIFPQDHEFDKDDLVRMWIALGFIQPSNIRGETLEDTGRRYFNILIQKSFFDEFCTDDDKVCYKMHDLLHELAQSVSAQECFTVMDEKELSNPPDTIRHLSIYAHHCRLQPAFQRMRKFKNLRSLFLSFSAAAEFDENVISEIFKASKTIRLLVVNYQNPIFERIKKMPETIGCLIHLRYLKVKCLDGFNLPRSISHLYRLRYIISKRIENLEMDGIGRKALKTNENCQLVTDGLVIRDPSVLLTEPLRSISSFPALSIDENDELVSFPSETEQWLLQHRSSLFELVFFKLRSLQSLPSSLEGLSWLEMLQVISVPQLRLMPNLPASLKTLYLYNLESLQCLPSSLSAISSLKRVHLKKIPLLRSLPELPSSLRVLILVELESLDCLPCCLPDSLNKLTIDRVPRLLELPDLPASLEELYVDDCHPRLMERYGRFQRWR